MSGHELILRRAEDDGELIVNPESGEAVALADATPTLLAAVLRVIEVELNELKEVKRNLGLVMLDRMDAGVEWTARARGVKVTAPSPSAKAYEWDAELLDQILGDLVREGVITQEARLKACEQRVTTVALVPGINRLLKLPGVEARLVFARREAPPKPRSIRVSVTAAGE